METRANEKLFLLGHDESQIIGCKLPSKGQILKVLFYNMRKIKLNLRPSAYLVIKEAEVLWDKARIPTSQNIRSVQKVEALYHQWKTLQKTCKRRTALQEKREHDFVEELDDLFDIAHGDALSIIQIEEDRLFLLNQRKKGRPGGMIGSDRALFEREKRRNMREERELIRQEKYHQEQSQNLVASQDYSDDEGQLAEIDSDELQDNFQQTSTGNVGKKRKMKNFITPKLVATLDKCKVSDRDAVRILIGTAEALGHDLSQLAISKSTIRNCRKQIRSETAINLKEKFQNILPQTITVHWDGKLLPSLTGKEKVDRLPVVITSTETEHLLGVPALQAGTGRQQAEAIIQLLKEWNLTDKVQALCFDTTATNTGRLQGACVILEQELGKDLLYLPCRHHIYEIVLKSVFEKRNLSSSGPTLSIFQKFKGSWAMINQENFKFGVDDEKVSQHISVFELEDLATFFRQYLKIKQPRADYKELLELSLIFLGEHDRNYKFKSPGAYHHARWMAKAIYSLKMFLFREEFVMSSDEIDAIRDACLFIVKIYVKVWIEAPIAAKAPNQDLLFIKSLFAYKNVNENVSNATLGKFRNHLWYLAAETVGFSFFDETITSETKTRMIKRLRVESENESKRLITDIQDLQSKSIEDFVTKNTLHFFERFSIATDFFQKEPSQWQNEPSYIQGVNIVSKMRVVNDTAERNVKLMEEYNNSLSKNEEEKQFILQIVTDYRKNYKGINKSDLMEH